MSIRVLPDTSRFREDLKKELKKLQKTTRIEIPVDLDTKRARAQMSALQAQLKRLGGGVSLGVGVDGGVSSVTKEIDKATNSVKTLRNGFADLRAKSRRGLDDIRLRVMAIGDGFKKIRTNGLKNNIKALNPLKLVRGLADADLSMRRLRKGTGGFVSMLGKAGQLLAKGVVSPLTATVGQLGNLSRVGGIAIAVAGAIPAIVGPIAGLLAGLPSLIAAAGAGVAAIALGMDGIKKAFAPLSDEMAQLKKVTSAAFEEVLQSTVKNLDKVFPALEFGMVRVANGLGAMADGFSEAVSSAEGLSAIKETLSNIGLFFTQLKPFVKDFTTGFLELARAGSQDFGFLSQSLNNFGADFKTFVQRIASDGTLTGAFQGLSAVLDGLFDAFLKIFDAGLKVMAQIGGPMGDALSQLGNLVVAIMPTLGDFANLLFRLISALGTALVPVFEALQPVFKQFATNMGDLLVPLIQQLAPALQVIVQFLGEMFNTLRPLFPVLAQVAGIFKDVLVTAFNAIKPALPAIANSLGKVAEIIGGALKQAAPTLTLVAETLGKALATALETLAPILPVIIQAFLDLVMAILPLLPPLVQLVGDMLPPLIKAFAEIAVPILNMATNIAQVLVPAVKGLIDILSSVLKWIADLALGISQKLGDVINWFSALPGKVIAFFKDAGKWLYNAGKQVIQGFLDGLYSMIKPALDAIDGIVNGFNKKFKGSMHGAFEMGSPSRLAARYGAWIGEGLAIGIEDGGKDANRAMEGMIGGLRSTSVGLSSIVQVGGGIEIAADSIPGAVESALSGWSVAIDDRGGRAIAKMVNKANNENKRR